MAARQQRHFQGNAEARRRSGPKQSRAERRTRFERRALQRGKTDQPTERRFGILLKEAVAKQLARIGVPHKLYDYQEEYARSERVELAVFSRNGGTTVFEIDWTLRRGVRGKITDFIRAATVRASTDVPRVYLEIEDRVGYALKPLAERVAHAIRDIMSRLERLARRAEQGNVIGLALIIDHGRKAELLPMRLMRMIGVKARSMLIGLLGAMRPPDPGPEHHAIVPAKQEEAAPEAQPTPVRRPPRAASQPRGRPSLFQSFLKAWDRFPGFVPHPVPVFATRADFPLRMPFRR